MDSAAYQHSVCYRMVEIVQRIQDKKAIKMKKPKDLWFDSEAIKNIRQIHNRERCMAKDSNKSKNSNKSKIRKG